MMASFYKAGLFIHKWVNMVFIHDLSLFCVQIASADMRFLFENDILKCES